MKKNLCCTLSGSTKEVYETGSQVADLFITLSTLLRAGDNCLGDHLKVSINSARVELFPDLALEMGLEILSPEVVEGKISMLNADEGVMN